MCQVRVGRVQLPPAVGGKGDAVWLRHLAHLWWVSPLVSFTKNFSKGQFGQLVNQRITEVNGNKTYRFATLKKKLALPSKHGGSLMGVPMISLWFLMIVAWLSLWDQHQQRSHPSWQAATASTCRTTDFKASTFAPEVRRWSDGYPTHCIPLQGGSSLVAKVARLRPMGDQWSLSP